MALDLHELLVTSQATAPLIEAVKAAQHRVTETHADVAQARANLAGKEGQMADAIADLNRAIDALAHPPVKRRRGGAAEGS